MAVFKNAVGIPDQDAINFINAAGITTPTQIGAINRLVLDLKGFLNPNYPTVDIWNKMKAIYPMVGQPGVSSSFEINLKDPNTFRGTFVGSWTYASTGVTGNGGYFSSNFPLNTFSDKNNIAFGLYSRTDLNGQGVGMYVKSQVEFYGKYTSFGRQYSYLFEGNNNGNERSSYLGLNSHSRISSSQKYMQTKTIIDSYTSNTDSTALDSSIVLFSKTGQGSDYNEYALYYISEGLNITELLNLNTAVQRFQTTLGRQI